MDEYLAHIGMPRRSGRFPWGSGNRPFQSLEKGKLKAASDSPRHKASSARKRAKEREASLEKARKAKADKAEYEKKKQKALSSGSAAEVLKYKGKLTNKELQEAYQRLNYEKLINEIAKADVEKKKTLIKTFDDVENVVKRTTSYVDTGTKAWNSFAKIWNSFSDDDDQITIIGEKKKS